MPHSDLIAGVEHLRKGDWVAAHEIAQEDGTSQGAWLHGIVHIIEGDESNARYWYHKAHRPFPGMECSDSEMEALMRALQT